MQDLYRQAQASANDDGYRFERLPQASGLKVCPIAAYSFQGAAKPTRLMALYPKAVIMVFCKAPIAGQVKTRLIPSLSAEEAALLHSELAEKTLQTATQAHLCDVSVWCSPATDHPFFKDLADSYPVKLRLQQGADLGARMHHAFVQALAHYQSALIIGCDCPSLTGADLGQALAELDQGKPCVLAPAEDGGYVLIGLNQPQPLLFEAIPWGTANVLALTRAKLQSLNIDHKELNTHWDLDTIADLARYRKASNTSF